MKTSSKQSDRSSSGSPGAVEQEQELVWKPSSGHGSESALKKLKSAERVKSNWRRVRSDPIQGNEGHG